MLQPITYPLPTTTCHPTPTASPDISLCLSYPYHWHNCSYCYVPGETGYRGVLLGIAGLHWCISRFSGCPCIDQGIRGKLQLQRGARTLLADRARTGWNDAKWSRFYFVPKLVLVSICAAFPVHVKDSPFFPLSVKAPHSCGCDWLQIP